MNVWVFDAVFASEPIGYQAASDDLKQQVKEGKFNGQMQWWIFGLARTLNAAVNPGGLLLNRPPQMKEVMDNMQQELNQRVARFKLFLREHCLRVARRDGTNIVLFKKLAAVFLNCLTEEVVALMARLGLKGESRGACATNDARGKVVMMKTDEDGIGMALQVRSELALTLAAKLKACPPASDESPEPQSADDSDEDLRSKCRLFTNSR